MNRNRHLIVFDFETDGKYPATCNIVEIAAIPIDLRNLSILTDDVFEVVVRPKELEDSKNNQYYETHEDTINWHANQRNVDPSQIYKKWSEGVPEKEAWGLFCEYVEGYATGTKWDLMPIPAGQNIRGFDLPICERYGNKYKKLKFNKRDVFDLMDLTRIWFVFTPDAPEGLNMDALREFFGLSSYGAHTAKQDVLDTCHLINKFLSLHERIAPKIVWNHAKETQKV